MNLNAAVCLFIVVNFQKPMIKSIIQKKDRHLGKIESRIPSNKKIHEKIWHISFSNISHLFGHGIYGQSIFFSVSYD